MWALHKLRKIMAANFGSLINITALLSSPTADSPDQEVARPFPLVSRTILSGVFAPIPLEINSWFGCLFVFLTTSASIRLSHIRVPRLMSDNFTFCHIETEREDHNLCLRRSPYTDTTQPVRSKRGDQTHNLLARRRALYPLSYHLQ